MILATPASAQKAQVFNHTFCKFSMKQYRTHTVVFVIGKPFLFNVTYCVSGTCSQL